MIAMAGLCRLPLALLACAAALTCASAADKDFRDWHAACDNLRNCNAYGLQADDPTYAYVRIARSGAPSAPARITIAADMSEKATVVLAFDDAALPGLPAGPVTPGRNGDDPLGRVVIDDPAAVDTLVASMRKAQTLTVRRIDPPDGDKSEQETSTISLAGAIAALLWIDEQQQRLGTTTAFIRRGDRPASSVPPQPQAPAVQAAKPPDGPAYKAPPKELRTLTAKAKALCGDDEKAELDDSGHLSRYVSIYNFGCPGMSGAYNRAAVLLIAPDGRPQEARAVKFAYPPEVVRNDHAPEVMPMNVGFDQSTMMLLTFNKGRGIADCGAAEDWAWDGQTFQLARLRRMPHCKGIPEADWPVHYRAERR